MPLPITHVATTDISDMMRPGPERRMELPDFADEFVDFPHYIIRITERIWHDRQVGLCLDWYAPDCAIHTLAGDITGAQTVVDNTWATLAAFPDRRLDGDNVVWSDEGGRSFYSSHRITSKMTNLGASDFGTATGKRVRVVTIADCLCRENRIVEEWLVRDNLSLVRQLGFDADEIAGRQAAVSPSLITFHAANRRRAQTSIHVPCTGAALTAQRLFDDVWNAREPTRAAAVYDFRVSALYPGSALLYGPDEVAGVLAKLFAAFPDARAVIEHVAEIPYLGAARDVAVRWSLAGTHSGDGPYGPPSGAPVYILGVSHFRIIGERIFEEQTIWDDLAVRRQIAEARRAV